MFSFMGSNVDYFLSQNVKKIAHAIMRGNLFRKVGEGEGTARLQTVSPISLRVRTNALTSYLASDCTLYSRVQIIVFEFFPQSDPAYGKKGSQFPLAESSGIHEMPQHGFFHRFQDQIPYS
jgi:hypothetical protein